MVEIKNRLSRYAAVAAVVPAAGAHAAIVAQTGLNVVVAPNTFAAFDFGPGFGEVFRFQVVSGSSTDRAATYFAGLFQFDPANGNVGVGSVLAGRFPYATSSGGSASFTTENPQILGLGAPISVEQPFRQMTSSLGTFHDLVSVSTGSTPARQSGGYDWYPDTRGYLGFRMVKGGDAFYGWFDVESLGWSLSPNRGVAGPLLIIHGWGFQDEPGRFINAGDIPAPAAGGLLALALGAAGVRRSRKLA